MHATTRLEWTLALTAMLGVTGCVKPKPPVTTPPEPAQSAVSAEPTAEPTYTLIETPPIDTPTAAFVLNGEPFCFTGTNNYYLPWRSQSMVNDVLDRAVALDMKVIRTWAFLDIGSLDGTVPHVDDKEAEKGTKEGVYFQYWDTEAGEVRINEDENGVPRLDYVLHAARERGLKVILTLTNNWHNMGGMDQYVVWYGATHHHEFFTHEAIKDRYKTWARYLVNRVNRYNGSTYRDDPTIFAWELGNELRCRNYEAFDAEAGWDHTTMVTWADEMSAYLKAIAPNHLVAFGDEGFFNNQNAHWTYNGPDGADHEAIIALPGIDFATFHLYPDHWQTDDVFGNQWIADHLDAARRIGKPTVLEEYGTTVQRDSGSREIVTGWERRNVAYQNWHTIMRERGGAGTIAWMLAGIDDDKGMYPDYDGFAFYSDGPTGALMAAHGKRFPKEAMACRLAGDLVDTKQTSPFVHIAAPPR